MSELIRFTLLQAFILAIWVVLQLITALIFQLSWNYGLRELFPQIPTIDYVPTVLLLVFVSFVVAIIRAPK